MRLRVWLLCLTIAACGAFAGVGAQSASAFPVVGLNIAGVPTDAQLAQAQALGAKTVRMFLLWSDVQPQRGALAANFVSGYAHIISVLSADGINTDFVVVRSPSWETGTGDPTAPPKNPADYANFLAQFAASPGIAGNHVAYEIWNEEDAPTWWTGAPDPVGYAALVKAAAPALRAADPTAVVVLGPTTGNNYPFISQLYQNGIGGLTDAVAVHTDNGCETSGPDVTYMTDGQIGQFAFLGYRSVHNVMVANGEGSHPIWMTEFGWNSSQTATGGTACASGAKPSGVTEDQQAQFITEAFHCMDADPYLQVANWFTLDDDPSQPDDSIRHYGLLDPAGNPKPDYQAFHLLATQGDQLSGACGNFTGPAITILTPKLGTSYATTLPIQASAVDAQGITRITFTYDQGTNIEGFAAPASGTPVGLTWHGASALSLGPHTINVQAVDKSGNVSNASVQVVKVSPTSLLAVGPANISLKTVICVNGLCTLGGDGLTPAGAALPGGKVEVVWQLLKKVSIKVKGKRVKVKRFRTQHKQITHANKPFRFRQRLKAGQWRVQVVFLPPKPLKKSASQWQYFSVKVKAKKLHH
jgi:hypothetical protein